MTVNERETSVAALVTSSIMCVVLYVYFFLSLFQELPNNGVMLVYVSGDGCPGSGKAGEEGTCVQKKKKHILQLHTKIIFVISLHDNAFSSPQVRTNWEGLPRVRKRREMKRPQGA